MYNAAFPAMLLSRSGGGERALAIVNASVGIAMLVGSLAASVLPEPKSRVRIICNTLFLSMSTENFFFGLWQFGSCLVSGCNLRLDLGSDYERKHGRALSQLYPGGNAGTSLFEQKYTAVFYHPGGIPFGGVLVDKVFEPFMAMQQPDSLWLTAFGSGKGSGAAMFFMIIGILGVVTCLIFRNDSHIWKLEE